MSQIIYKSPLDQARAMISDEDLRFIENWVNDGKGYIESPRWRFDKENRKAFKDLGSYQEDNFNDLSTEADGTITKWLKDHGFNYKLSKGDYEWKTKGKVGRNWVNTSKGTPKTARNRILLDIDW